MTDRGAHGEDGPDEAIQEFLDGRIDEAELRRRLGGAGDAGKLPAGISRDLAAYRAVWRALSRSPASRLPSDFARRTARAALARRRAGREDRWMGALVAASSTAAAAAAAVAFGILIAGSGLELPAAITRAVAATGGDVPYALAGVAGAAVVLLMLDRILSRGGDPTPSTG